MNDAIPMTDSENGPVHLATWGFHGNIYMSHRTLCGKPVHLIPFGGAPITCEECGQIAERQPGF